MNEDPAEAPSYLHMSVENRIPRNTWLIHFSDDAWEIKHSGFKYGTDDYTKLGLTTCYKTKMGMKSGEGWNFAFEALSGYDLAASKRRLYGKNAVMFMSSGVKVYHYGDEEHQIIFQGNLIRPQDMVLLMRNKDGWQVISKYDRVIVTGEFNKILKWIINNYQQYRRVL